MGSAKPTPEEAAKFWFNATMILSALYIGAVYLWIF